ncbi:peptide deformylase [Roseivivax jejudonensis]|uniref:peptide deformylase n=1 Tax=Roseivivax jejudonensis TaxID=1529041 RepID=UPI003520D2EB
MSRTRAVTVRFLDETGAETERDFVLLWATSVQHQIDHLDGRLFVDRLSRTRAVTVRFLDETGAETERDFVLLWATSVQHQIDHLDGRLFVDRLSRTKRDMLVRRSRKAAR